MNPLKKAKLPSKIRNMDEFQQVLLEKLVWPIHSPRKHAMVNMHESQNSNLNDPYHWITKMT
jgi:hypothetical protein